MGRLLLVIALASLLAAGSSPAASAAEQRVALVIGNSDYRNVPALRNPTRDAAAVARLLRASGFSTVNLRTDVDQAGMREALQAFAQLARQADVAVVYFAGHGMELQGTNYLIPVDARLSTDTDAPYETVSLDLVMEAARGSRVLSLIILDACRNNPFVPSMRMSSGSYRSAGRGLAKIEPSGNTLVVYAARDGTTAADGNDEHSPFTAALLRHLPTPGLEIGLLFRNVRDDVLGATRGQQLPFTYGSLGRDPFFFVDANAQPAAITQPAPQLASPTPRPERIYDFPHWGQVVSRYPGLARLVGRGGADLCGRCRIGPDGYLVDCQVAGAAGDPELREGVKLMASMMRVYNRDGSSAVDDVVQFPATLGRAMPPPPPEGYCKSPDSSFIR